MKIWLIPNRYFPVIGGVEVVVDRLRHEFIDKGHNVTILTSKYPKNLKKFEFVNGVNIYRFSFSIYRGTVWSMLLFLFRVGPNMAKLIYIFLKEKPNIVNVHYVDEHTFYILLLRNLFKFPFIINLHGSDVLKNPINFKNIQNILIKTLEKADHVIANSKHLLNEAKIYYSNLKNKSSIIPNGINLNDFIDNHFSEKCKNPYIVCIGRLEKEKGHDLLIKAMYNISKRHPRWRLIIIGDGRERHGLLRLTEELGLGEIITFLGAVENKEALLYIKNSEFLVLPSRSESFGIVLIEAMAYRKAVVATSVGGVPEIVSDGINGFLIEPEDHNSLFEAISKLIQDNQLRKILGEKGFNIIKNSYEWHTIAKKYMSIFQKIAEKYE
jgi:glycosyltransferase involved in cell wall biosynthesis